MNDKDGFVLGEIHSTVTSIKVEHGKQLSELSTLIRDVREKGCVIGSQNADNIKSHSKRINRMEGLWFKSVIVGVIVIVVVAVCILGVNGFVGAIVQR